MPLTANRIKYLLSEEGETLSSLSRRWGWRVEELSMCIRRSPGRVYPELRIKISEFLGMSVERVFGPHPLTSVIRNNKAAKHSRAA